MKTKYTINIKTGMPVQIIGEPSEDKYTVKIEMTTEEFNQLMDILEGVL